MANSGRNDFSDGYTYTFAGGSADQNPNETLWILENAGVFPLSASECLLRNRRNQAQVVVKRDVFEVLQLCRQFRTLSAHAQTICQTVPGLTQQQQSVRQVLATLAQQGFFRSADSLITELQTPVTSTEPAPLEKVFIRTCNRPASLRRLLDSLAANEAEFGNRYRYIVVDDSSSTDARQDNAAAVTACAAAGLGVGYYGTAEQQQLTSQLLETFSSQRDSLRWLLSGDSTAAGQSYGRSWNHALLLGAGQRIVIMDDDTVCKAYHSPYARPGLALSERHEEVFFYPDWETLMTTVEPAALDPLAQYARVLGLPLGAALRTTSTALDVAAVQDLTAESLSCLNAAAPILVTTASLFGDPGTRSMFWLYHLDGAARRQFIASDAAYRVNTTGRHLWKGYGSVRLVPDRVFMTNCLTGLDNSRLLPPTIPQWRGEDALFGSVLKYLYPQSLYWNYAWGILHQPEPPRRWDKTTLDTPLSLNALDFIADLVRTTAVRCQAKEPRQRLATLAAACVDLAYADEPVLRAAIEEHSLAARADLLRRLNEVQQDFQEAPAYWRADVQRILQANARLSEPVAVESVRAVRHALQHYARALKLWPAAWNYCQTQRLGLLPDVL